MDPATATGLAASVVTFVQFEWQLFANSRAIYRSADGLPRNRVFVDSIANDLHRLSEGISTDWTENASEELKILARTCTDISGELCSALGKLKIKGKRTRWACFRAALKDVWRPGEIEDIQSRLDNVRAQLHLRLTADISIQSHKVASSTNKLEFNLSREVKESEQAVLIALQKLDLKISRLSLNISDQTSSMGKEEFDGDTQTTSMQNVPGFNGSDGHDINREAQLLLESLLFRTKEVRDAQIPEAHEQTFRWIFEDDASPFCRWLCSDGGIFWISGKAGSGKSTLMKLISDDFKTQDLLQIWSGSKKVVLAKHFFWKPGEDMQKSREGLLRSLLYDNLKQCPELIPAVLEALPYRSFDKWYTHELLDVFTTLSNTAPTYARLCFIIDGLDEYVSSRGHHLEELIQVIRTLSKQTWVKVCVSSRPWNTFQDAFGSDKNCWLKLEDLTRKDIETYVHDKLHLSLGKDAYDDRLVETIVTKAEGVFFWLYLAVCDLLQGVRDGDRPSDLLQKAARFPPDLEEFLQRILVSIDPEHQEEAAKHFQLALQGIDGTDSEYANQPLLIHTFVGEIEDVENIDEFLSTSSWDKDAIQSRLESGRRRLVSRCKGLLETSEPLLESTADDYLRLYESPVVHFFHRSVVELISRTYSSNFEKFDSIAFICKAYNIMLDAIAYQSQHDMIQQGYPWLALELLTFAMRSERRFGQLSKETTRWLRQADSTITHRSDYQAFDNLPSPPYPLPKMIFLETCTFRGFASYVRLTLAEHPQPHELSLRLLHVIHWGRYIPFNGVNYVIEMYEFLVEKLGGDVSLICPCCSGSVLRNIWTCALSSVRRSHILGEWLRKVKVIRVVWTNRFDTSLQRYKDAFDYIVPFDDHPGMAYHEEENPKEGLAARTILQLYFPKQSLKKLCIESLSGRRHSERNREWNREGDGEGDGESGSEEDSESD